MTFIFVRRVNVHFARFPALQRLWTICTKSIAKPRKINSQLTIRIRNLSTFVRVKPRPFASRRRHLSRPERLESKTLCRYCIPDFTASSYFGRQCSGSLVEIVSPVNRPSLVHFCVLLQSSLRTLI